MQLERRARYDRCPVVGRAKARAVLNVEHARPDRRRVAVGVGSGENERSAVGLDQRTGVADHPGNGQRCGRVGHPDHAGAGGQIDVAVDRDRRAPVFQHAVIGDDDRPVRADRAVRPRVGQGAHGEHATPDRRRSTVAVGRARKNLRARADFDQPARTAQCAGEVVRRAVGHRERRAAQGHRAGAADAVHRVADAVEVEGRSVGDHHRRGVGDATAAGKSRHARADDRVTRVGVGRGEDQRARALLGQTAGVRDDPCVGQDESPHIHRAVAGQIVVVGHLQVGQGHNGRAVAAEGHRVAAERRIIADRHRSGVDRRSSAVGVGCGERQCARIVFGHRAGRRPNDAGKIDVARATEGEAECRARDRSGIGQGQRSGIRVDAGGIGDRDQAAVNVRSRDIAQGARGVDACARQGERLGPDADVAASIVGRQLQGSAADDHRAARRCTQAAAVAHADGPGVVGEVPGEGVGAVEKEGGSTRLGDVRCEDDPVEDDVAGGRINVGRAGSICKSHAKVDRLGAGREIGQDSGIGEDQGIGGVVSASEHKCAGIVAECDPVVDVGGAVNGEIVHVVQARAACEQNRVAAIHSGATGPVGAGGPVPVPEDDS